MRKLNAFAILFIAFFITSCTSSKKTTGAFVNTEKLNGRSFHKLFIEVATVDIEVRSRLENDLLEAAASQGYAAVKSVDLIPFSLKELKLPAKEEIELKVKETGCDAILLVSLFRKGETIAYTPGTVVKGNDQFGAGVLLDALNWQKRNLNNHEDIKPIPGVNTPGSFSYNGGGFILQSNIYDVPAEEIMFFAQSNPIDVTAVDKVGKAFANSLIAQLKTEKLLK